jgi:hypothetical protein
MVASIPRIEFVLNFFALIKNCLSYHVLATHVMLLILTHDICHEPYYNAEVTDVTDLCMRVLQ